LVLKVHNKIYAAAPLNVFPFMFFYINEDKLMTILSVLYLS